MTSKGINRGLAAMPAQERSLLIDGRGLGGDQSYNQRQHREAMARNTSPKGSNPRADVQLSQWDDAAWDQDHDEAAGHRARRLLSRSNSGLHRFGDQLRRLAPMACGRTLGKAPRGRDRGLDGDLRRLLRRAVVAAWRGADQSRNGDAVARGRDRGQYRSRQYRRGRRHPDRARRPIRIAVRIRDIIVGTATMPLSRARRKPRSGFRAPRC